MSCAFNEVTLSARIGCVFRFSTILKNPDGTVMDLTGYGAQFVVREKLSDASPVLSLSSGSGITITALTGKIAVEITKTQTAALDGEYFYTLSAVEPGSQVVHLFSGKITFEESVLP